MKSGQSLTKMWQGGVGSAGSGPPKVEPHPILPGGLGVEPGGGFQLYSEETTGGGGNTTSSGSFNYDAMHPPAPDQSGIEHPNLESTVMSAPADFLAIGGLGQYWADEIGAPSIDQSAFITEFSTAFEDDVAAWRNDWGGDPSWQQGGADPQPEDWKLHGGKRTGPDVDLTYMTEVDTKFRSLETALGYNSSETDLIHSVYPGYGEEINVEELENRGNFPEMVTGSPNEEGELVGGEMVPAADASGAWGQYLEGVQQTKDTYDLEKSAAKDTYDADLKNIRAQKQALGRGAGASLRDVVKKGGITGFRRGGRRTGGYRRGDVEGLQAQARELGGLREKARSAYSNKLDRLALDKKQSFEGKANILTSRVETEFTELAGDLKVAENKYQSDSLGLELDRADTIFDIFQYNESQDPDEPWPQDPDKIDEDD